MASEKSNVVELPPRPGNERLPSRPEPDELGITGTTNWSGDIFDEENSRLYHQGAFGQPGNRTWGEWTKRIRTDPAFAAGLEYTASQLRDAAVTVEPAEGVKGAEQQADFVRWNLLEAMEPGWQEVIQRISRGALGYGHAIEELVAAEGVSKYLPGGKGWLLKKLADRQPVSLHQNGWLEEEGELAHIRQWGQGRDGKWCEVLLPASKVLLFSWNRTGNNYRGVSQGRPVYYPMRIREQLAKMIGVTLVREGAGIPIAYSDDKDATLSDEQRKDLQTFLGNCVFHENSSAVMPSGWKLNWVFSGSANKGHVVDAYNSLGLLVLQQFQAQHLVLGTGDTGSRSVGEVHTAQARNFAHGVIAFLEGVFNGVGERPYTGLVRKMVEWNWGPQAAYPRLRLMLKRNELGPVEKMLAIKAAVDAGAVTITEKDENQLREDLGLEPLEKGERDAEMEKRAARAPQLVEVDEDEEGEEDPPKKMPPQKARANAVAPWAPRRPLRPSEQAIDFANIDSRLTNARAEFERGVRPLLVEALVRLAPAIKDAMADGDPSEVAQLQLPTERIAAYVDSYLAGLHADGWRELSKERRRGSGPKRFGEEEKEDDAPSPSPPEPTKTQKTLTAMRKQVVRRISQRVLSDVEREAIEVIRQGGDESEVVSRTVQTQLEGGLKGDAGILVTKAFNMGREDFARERGDEVESVELSALLDGKQCIPCDGLDGRTFEPFSEEHEAHVPPLTALCDGAESCRCLMVYNFKE